MELSIIDKDVSIIFPCYNESLIFEDSVKRIKSFMDSTELNYELIFVEDNGSDNTKELVKTVVKENKNFTAVFHKKNIGRGGSVSDGLKIAKGAVVGYLDIGLEISPSYILKMYTVIEKSSDVACAYRAYEFKLIFFLRTFLHVAYAICSKFILGLPISDPNAGCKFFKREKILPILEKVIDKHWFWDTEIVKRSQLAGLSISEVNVIYIPNEKKTSTVKIFSDTIHFVKKLLWLRKELLVKK